MIIQKEYIEGIHFKYHTFGLSETIRAIIQKYNYQHMEEFVLNRLCNVYNDMNNSSIPRLGERVKIPLITNSSELSTTINKVT